MRGRLLSAALCLFLAGCEEAREPRFCTAIAVDALAVTVVDAATGRRICDATVVAVDGGFSEELRGFGPGPDCSYSGPVSAMRRRP